MKIGSVLPVILLISACASEKEGTMKGEDTITGRWELVEVIAGWTGKVTPASVLDYRQYLVFYEDGTFLKTRSNGQSASGTYTIKELSDGVYVEVAFNDENTTLLESCSGIEYLRLEKGNRLIGGSLPCDGPGLAYAKAGGISD